PIWIGTAEATAIAMAQQGVVPPRPMTHDLLCDVIAALGRAVAGVAITAVEDSTFFAQLTFDDGTIVGSRASDALAVALRTNARIWCAEDVMDEASVHITEHDEVEPDPLTSPEADERELRRFRAFLDDVEPEDFDS
ncbi:MAG TPA: bifunctional nuclease family protein, partial [Chloroflexota bacterium]|nr:bifunctional nuclease family protein [Chloroflexota bacterium]